MIRFFSSLTFLYAASICMLVVYAFAWYRSYAMNRTVSRKFPIVFGAIALMCLAFLFINMNPPRALKTYSNLDHHFLRHDGYRVKGSITLGGTDTSINVDRLINRFVFSAKGGEVNLRAPYSEEPLFVASGNGFELVSPEFPAEDHGLEIRVDSFSIQLKILSGNHATLRVNDQVFTSNRDILKGINAWNYFRENSSYINSTFYTDEKLVAALKQVYLIRKNQGARDKSALQYFISGRLFQSARSVSYDGRTIDSTKLAYSRSLPSNVRVYWGIGTSESNRRQIQVIKGNEDSFTIRNAYPVSYPLTAEKGMPVSVGNAEYTVTKFLVSSSTDIARISPVFREGFHFTPAVQDNALDFSALLLTYKERQGNKPVEMVVRGEKGNIAVKNDQFLVPANAAPVEWIFSIKDTRNWQLGSTMVSSSAWTGIIFGAMLFFVLFVLGNWFFVQRREAGWIWQVLSCVTMLLLTTRIFLYWRYKTFPPFEGMDAPSLQQLNSPWNFAIIILAMLALALVFGWGVVKKGWQLITPGMNFRRNSTPGISTIRKFEGWWMKGGRRLYFLSWAIILAGGGTVAALAGFDPAVCRHLAIFLILAYFLFLSISYRHSPLVKSSGESWWTLKTGSVSQLLISNPVKVLLSTSLLGLFSLVDIGFAILFFNFLLFNEAFLCINYAIAGLSAGSRKNARVFGIAGTLYLLFFIFNLTYGPYASRRFLDLPAILYTGSYLLFATGIAYTVVRLLNNVPRAKQKILSAGLAIVLFAAAWFFFPKERILSKAAMTRYRIDVMTMPISKAIENAYADGKNYTPVIRAAQNQWFINTFIDEENNANVNKAGFTLLQHAPQHKGAKYNAQATDLVSSRFLLAEHGKWAVLFYVLVLMLPAVLVASFYKLYPDFTNRVNPHYPVTTAAFGLLNYLLVAGLLVILAATGRYIFFGQDLPFGSILSKQSILFPTALIIGALLLFKKITPEQYPSRNKLIPAVSVLGVLAIMLFIYKPSFNRNKTFGAGEIAKDMDTYIQSRLQPVLDHFASLPGAGKKSYAYRDRQFTDSLRKMIEAGSFADAGLFLQRELENYSRSGFISHLDADRLLFLDLHSGSAKLAVNDNFFRIDPPPHLQQYWSGNVYGDSSIYNITVWNGKEGSMQTLRLGSGTEQPGYANNNVRIINSVDKAGNLRPCLVNTSGNTIQINDGHHTVSLFPTDSLFFLNPSRLVIQSAGDNEMIVQVEPDAFMRNYYVNGSRFYVYPLAERFIWARNFAENVASNYSSGDMRQQNAFVSIDATLMDSLTGRINGMMVMDSSYKKGAEYAISIADGNGRLIAMADHIKGLYRPDPNDKGAFNAVIQGENGIVSQSLLRKQVGNLNMLRMNPGPGSTLKPIIFVAIASQLNMDWNAFAAEGFSIRQQYFGGEKVGEYDFEKNNGRISTVRDYLRLSDNYYHANLLLLGSYSKQNLQEMLAKHFATGRPRSELHWPWFRYQGKDYWLDGFENWPGFSNGRANFGSDSSFVSMGLVNNFGIYTSRSGASFDGFNTGQDAELFRGAAKRSGFIMPEYALFDQKAAGMHHDRPNELFLAAFRGHVKGSSQVMVPPVKMVEAFGKLVNQDRNYTITLDPFAKEKEHAPFITAESVSHQRYLDLVKESVFGGMRDALYRGTASVLGTKLKEGSPYYYYAKTGTTGDDTRKEKSKLFVIIISKKDISAPGYNFRDNKFYTIYFTSQNGPAKQNEQFQAEVIKMVEQSPAFKKYMEGD